MNRPIEAIYRSGDYIAVRDPSSTITYIIKVSNINYLISNTVKQNSGSKKVITVSAVPPSSPSDTMSTAILQHLPSTSNVGAADTASYLTKQTIETTKIQKATNTPNHASNQP
jgi:hypothetical protein